MSLASIIFGLLIWFSLPPFYSRMLKPKYYFYFRLACKAIGAMLIAAGVLAGFL